jgi:F-type H+-transporting ATPase subunit b|tara:strand:- start:554 stop:1132 length:579 start_codon:yes stop_codon:yes gene_type:complete
MFKKIILKTLAVYFLSINFIHAAESGGMPQLDPEFWFSQIFWLVITFGILYLVLSKIILPKISDNLETRKSQILENLEFSEKQRNESEAKLKEFDNIILKSKIEAKNLFNESRKKLLDDINSKRQKLEKEIDKEVKIVEAEIDELKKKSPEKINKIAIETSADLINQLIGVNVNNSSITAIVSDISSKNKAL